MSREFSGRIADTVFASDCFFGSFFVSEVLLTALEVGEGETVGNSPDGSVGEVRVAPPLSVLSGSGGSVSAGSVLPGVAQAPARARAWARP